MFRIETHSFEETVEFGKRLGYILNSGDIICLSGDLGTGKTALTNGIAKALGINSYITSPTFTLVNEYEGRLPLYHFDVYRIADSDEMFDIGFEEYINGQGITIIEWGEQIQDILPKEIIKIKITKNLNKGLDVREIAIDFTGDKYCRYQNKL
ncbi:tRNA threonylcarbamoyladenosine biosynthesis protein TsaE [Ruminiclostridium sufflavum DSM 19573]|uniref:tRNA threonylcarbamoyladenosine biosynthesis protein TsaE n=1 Tax=Ruminiclostridium sufflavum DSM 19573 TaxID=1121337 RepID=A0A318XIN8_9FIRM|nr:tRNA (adenosine(37)-N6)-threonylcarbamoyltransferase complex ATPase subunit type 1 TsaE [Ruminiclostridium sufflavum]PYG85693.1 tRNA threonylcarbamoyladenosine biosynthesis protein TsaE [Ruminiclostridium sufflavum DSM 19573]